MRLHFIIVFACCVSITTTGRAQRPGRTIKPSAGASYRAASESPASTPPATAENGGERLRDFDDLSLERLLQTRVVADPLAATPASPASQQEQAAATSAPSATADSKQRLRDFDELSLERLLDTRLITATRSAARKAAKSPAIMTIVTHDQILRSGARDLIDILLLIPGFQMGTDTFNGVYVGVRGLWGAEGRVLFQLNGHEMQDLLFGMVSLGNRFPVDWIERVEVIRGPGSAIYGGVAELAVVNIITHQPADFGRAGVYGSYGQLVNGVVHDDASIANTYGRRNLAAIAGHVFENIDHLSIGAAAFVGQGQRSDRTYSDLWGDSFGMAGNSALDPLTANVWGEWRGLKLNYLFDDYRTSHRDAYDVALPIAANVAMKMSSLDLSYDWNVLPELRITPRLRYVYQKPWQTLDAYYADDPSIYFDPTVQRTLGSLTAAWDVLDWLNLLIGTELTFDRAHEETNGFADPNDPASTVTEVSYRNVAAYAQGIMDTRWVDVSLGARFENHSQFGSSFVPRLALTRTFGAFHLKGLLGQAFRVPTISNLAMTPDVEPETATVVELEVGGRLTDNLYVGLNGFDTTAKKTIVYYWDPATETEGYLNDQRLGSRGFEIEARWKYGRHFVDVGYSFYDATDKNEVETFAVPGNDSVLLGFAPHKLTVSSAFELLEDLSLGMSMVYLSSQRFAYATVDPVGDPVLEDLGALLLLNGHLLYQNVGTPGLSVAVSVHNLINGNDRYAQPYNNGHAPLPGPSRELLLKLSYELPLN